MEVRPNPTRRGKHEEEEEEEGPRRRGRPVVRLAERPYQRELYEAALERNIIAYVPTGGGKTFISILLLTDMARRAAAAQAEERCRRKLMFFLVNTVPLVAQQAKAIRQFTPLSVGEYFAETTPGVFNKKAWMQEFRARDVLVMTPAVFLHILSRGFIRMRDISLIIFDECHHARKDHPYNQIMRDFYHAPDVDQPLDDRDVQNELSVGKQRPGRPKIFGMTASPVHVNIHQIQAPSSSGEGAVICAAELRRLERRMDCLVYTPADPRQVWQHIVRPKEALLPYKTAPPIHNPEIGWGDTIQAYDSLVRAKYVSKRVWKESQKRKRSIVPEPLPLEIELLCEFKLARAMLEEMGPACTLCAFQEKLQLYQELAASKKGSIADEIIDRIREDIIGHIVYIMKCTRTPPMTPKVATLLAKLREYKDKQEFRAIVFVEKRSTAKALSLFIQQLRKKQADLSFLACDYLVGHGVSTRTVSHYAGKSMSPTDQAKVIEDFRNGKLNLLIATSVAEEGLDIQPCNLVIRYSTIRSSTQYIQSRGRARHSRAEYLVMVPEDDLKQKETILNAQATEAQMEAACVRRDSDPEAEDAFMETKFDENELLQVVRTGAKITLSMSIGLLYLYTSRLPRDAYTRPEPEFDIIRVAAGFECRVRLPCDSAFMELRGPACPSRKEAKQRAALEACRKLREIGALDDCLLPIHQPAPKHASSVSYGSSTEDDAEADVQLDSDAKGEDVSQQIESDVEPLAPLLTHTAGYVPAALSGCWPIDTSAPLTLNLYSIRTRGALFRYGFVTSAREICHSCPPFSIYPRDTIRNSLYKRTLMDDRPPTPHPELGPTEVRVTYETNQPPLLTPEQVVLAWKFHFILSTTLLAVRPRLDDLLPQSHLMLQQSASVASISRPERMYLILPLTTNAETEAQSSSQGDGINDNAREMQRTPPSSVVIDWDLIQQVVRLAEEGILLDFNASSAPPSPNALDVIHPESNPSGLDSKADEDAFISSYKLSMSDGSIMMMREPLVLYQRHAPDNLYVLFRLRPDLTPASRLLGTRNRSIEPMGSRQEDPPASSVDENVRTFAIHYREKHGIEVQEDQPLCEVIYLSQPKSRLKPEPVTTKSDKQTKHTTLFAIPELCRVHPIHGSLLTDALNLPSILWKTECLFLVEEFVRLSGLKIRRESDWKWIIEALTAPSSDEESNYEALESFGDSILKLAVSTHLFLSHPDAPEGRLTPERTRVVCNSTLTRIANERGLLRFLTTASYSAHRFTVPGVSASAPSAQAVSDNTLADCVEAIIGASFLIGDLLGALHMMRWLGFELDGCEQLQHWRRDGAACPPHTTPSSCASFDATFFQGLESTLRYTFRNQALLLEACTHPSSMHAPRSYQRLEFLGDAVLDFLIMRRVHSVLISAGKPVTPLILSNLRTETVANSVLGNIIVDNRLHRYLRHCSQPLHQGIGRFIEYREASLRPDQATRARQADAPKALSDLLESLVGAVFIDCGGDLVRTWEVFAPLLAPHLRLPSSS